jgi:hypothetical protein
MENMRNDPPPPPVALGHWAGDRVLIVDKYCGSAADNFPPELLAAYPDVDPNRVEALEFAKDNLKHIALPGYAHKGPADTLFPGDRVWVVRNFTKRWYVRGDELVKPQHRRGFEVMGSLANNTVS